MKKPVAKLLAVIVLVFLAMSAFSQDSLDVHAKLRLADNKTSFRIGEPIPLVLELTADREGFNADTTHDGNEPTTDSVQVSPDAGVSQWRAEYGYGYRDYSSRAGLNKTPTTVEIVLNDYIRFDQPGRYSVKLTTRRIFPASTPNEYKPALTLTTNEVTLDIEAMSEADETNEIKRISALIESARGWQAEEAAGKQLAYLTGDVSSREKVRRFLGNEGKSGNYQGQIYRGLFIARNRALVLQLLETAMKDPDYPVSSGFLGVVTKLRLMRERAGVPTKPAPPMGLFIQNSDPRAVEIHDAYVIELAAGLDKRSGKSQTTTAMMILLNLPKDPQAATALSSQVRRILLSQFDTLHPFDQEYLLRVKWDELRDPSLTSSLKKMLSATGVASKNIHDTALKRLLEVSTDEARPYVIAEIRDPNSFVDREILGSLPDKTLPEVDSVLLEQIRQFSQSPANPNRLRLQHKAALAARYASKAIYADLMDIYRNVAEKMPAEALPGFLAYFARHDEAEGLRLLGQALEQSLTQQWSLLSDFTRLYFSESVDALLRKRLESDEQEIASTAAYLISLHGTAEDQKVIEQRLQRWRSDWSSRVADADSNLQGRVEAELITALTRGKSWKLPDEKVKELQRSCVTNICKQNFHLQ